MAKALTHMQMLCFPHSVVPWQTELGCAPLLRPVLQQP